jgi:glycosyltransferase involved in cell wall biosynthesis
MLNQEKKVALIHDFLINYGGAESVLLQMKKIFPDAPVHTLLYDKEKIKKWPDEAAIVLSKNNQLQASFLQKFPEFLKKRHKWLLPLMPTAPETFNLRDYDLVISSSSGFAKGVVLKPKTTHVCYMHAPMRYVWDWSHEYLQEQKLKGKSKLLARIFLNYLRMWDRASAERVDHFIANSNYTKERIWKYYRKEADVIYPPVDVEKFIPQDQHGDYFLTASRLTPNKRIKLIIDVFNKLKLPLVIIGDGKEKKELQSEIAKDANIKILGWVGEKKKVEIFQNARAFVFAAQDDFGIAPVEAMAAGKPVVAFRSGGVVETVKEGETGEFFDRPQTEVMADGIRRFIKNEKNYDIMKIRERAEEFSARVFRKRFNDYIEKI